jgi:signal transduction histidine kinase
MATVPSTQPSTVSGRRTRQVPFVAAIALSIGVVVAVEQRGSEAELSAAVERLASAQHVVARALTLGLERELGDASPGEARRVVRRFHEAAARVTPEQLVLVDTGDGLRDPLGVVRRAPSIEEALASGATDVVVPREEADALGLPRRRAAAGLGRLTGPLPLRLAVVTTSLPERARTTREQWISLAGTLLVSGVILGFGVIALRHEGQRLQLLHRLERAQLELERDEQLALAERIAVASALSIGVAHELATPLGVIAARVEQLRRAVKGEERAERALAAIDEQVQQMKLVMQGFLGLARGEPPKVSAASPTQLVDDAARAVQHRFTHAKVQLTLQTGPLLPVVTLDATLMRQALTNLLINALEASPAGTTVTLASAVTGTELVFSVEDEGVGIEPEVAQRATEPFFTTRGHAGGTGLGLAITNEIVRHHSGTLTLGPRRDHHGTLARITLPLVRRQSEAA